MRGPAGRRCHVRGSEAAPAPPVERLSPAARAIRWTGAIRWIVGVAALAWLVIRTGTRPSRLSYPCQQSALASATALLGAPLAFAGLSRRWALRAFVRSHVVWAMLTATLVIAAAMFAMDRVADPTPGQLLASPHGYAPNVYLVNNVRGVSLRRFGGVDDLVTLLGANGMKWHRSASSGLTSGPDGLIDRDDVVLIKVNAQWPQRGGTNTDVLRGVMRRIVEHPEGFVGEIIVADNGQGSGDLGRLQSNAEDTSQSVWDVVDDFAAEGWRASTFLWDTIRAVRVAEYDTGDLRDGYVVSASPDPQTSIYVSYPKFRTVHGTYVSFREGIWSPGTQDYDDAKLVVINMPVLKTHSIYAVTAAVKNHMGVITQSLATDSHNGVGRGGLGSVLAEVRMPDLTILDCIWILARPGSGPSAAYTSASRRDQLVASADPVALDAWAVKHILLPQIIANGFSYATYASTQDVDNPQSKFRQYLDRSMNEILAAGAMVTNDYTAVDLHVWAFDVDRDGDVDSADFPAFHPCFTGPGAPPDPACLIQDSDGDGRIDLRDTAGLFRVFSAEP